MNIIGVRILYLSACLFFNIEAAAERKTCKQCNDLAAKFKQLNDKLGLLENATKSQEPVVFLAELTTSIIGTNQHIVFNNVKLNVRNAYNPDQGKFVAPVNGIYQFVVTACSFVGNHIVLEIHVNGQLLGRLLAGDNVYSDCSSKQFLAHLTRGDVVYVRHETGGNYLLASNQYGYPSFSGFLLNADI